MKDYILYQPRRLKRGNLPVKGGRRADQQHNVTDFKVRGGLQGGGGGGDDDDYIVSKLEAPRLLSRPLYGGLGPSHPRTWFSQPFKNLSLSQGDTIVSVIANVDASYE